MLYNKTGHMILFKDHMTRTMIEPVSGDFDCAISKAWRESNLEEKRNDAWNHK